MTEPKTFKKSNLGKTMKASRQATAALAIGKIEKYTDTFILTYGQFSLIDALIAILSQTGPAHIGISTWTAAHAHLDRSKELLSAAKIKSFRMIVDTSFRSRQPEYYDHMIKLFGPNSIRVMKTHAKFMWIKNEDWNIVVRTSMNLNNNPRLENIEISENKEFCDYFESILNDVFGEIGEGENRKIPPELKSLQDFPLFQEVIGNHIDITNLREAKYTHGITDKKGTIEKS